MTSIIKVDNLQNQCGANIISESANVITIGASGDTVTLAAGASQSGFGRSGSVNWDTTAKTTGFTAVSGNGYFCNTTSAAFTVTLPATPAAGDIVAIADYANTSATNNITVGRNGVNIDGSAIDAKIKVNGQVYTLVYVDSTEGWKTVNQTFNQIATAEFVTATGGTITTCGDYKIHTFTGPGTFTVSSGGNAAGSNSVDYLVVAGGAGGGADGGGGGGAGGYRESKATGAPWTASPLASSTSLPVSATSYPITIGAGGPAPNSSPGVGISGNPSIFSTITSAGGGGAGGQYGPSSPTNNGTPGGSGGGIGRTDATPTAVGGTGNTPPTSPPQGQNGGGISPNPAFAGGAGGGGATVTGSSGNTGAGGPGGTGGTTSISGSPTAYAGGGGGAGWPTGASGGTGGTGGGANGSPYSSPTTPATANTGGGGGGGAASGQLASNGGSGIVVIRYKFQ
jgi:hypothetical protein